VVGRKKKNGCIFTAYITDLGVPSQHYAHWWTSEYISAQSLANLYIRAKQNIHIPIQKLCLWTLEFYGSFLPALSGRSKWLILHTNNDIRTFLLGSHFVYHLTHRNVFYFNLRKSATVWAALLRRKATLGLISSHFGDILRRKATGSHKTPLNGEWSCIRHEQCHSALECLDQKVVLTAVKHARSTTLVKEKSSPKRRIWHTACYVPPFSRRCQTSHPSLINRRPHTLKFFHDKSFIINQRWPNLLNVRATYDKLQMLENRKIWPNITHTFFIVTCTFCYKNS
jgi:hypothetical protein